MALKRKKQESVGKTKRGRKPRYKKTRPKSKKKTKHQLGKIKPGKLTRKKFFKHKIKVKKSPELELLVIPSPAQIWGLVYKGRNRGFLTGFF